jgi:mercuric ion transport protein
MSREMTENSCNCDPTRPGAIGFVAAALCCVAPVLAVWLGIGGLGWLIVYRERIAFAILFISFSLTAYRYWRREERESLHGK